MGGSTTTTSSQTSQVPQHIVDQGKGLFDTAKNYLSGTGGQYPTFDPTKDLAQGLNQTAGFTADQNKSFDIARANVGSHAPAMGAAFQLAGQAAQPIGYDANGKFMGNIGQDEIARNSNPYIQQVTERGQNDMARQYLQDQRRLQSDAINGGAAWGSQARNAGDQLAERFYKSAGDYTAQQNAAGYDAGAKLAQQNWQNYYGTAADNRSSAASLAQLFPQLAAQGKSLDSQDAQTLYAQGASQQALNQQAIDTARNNQLNAYQYPLDQLNTLSSLNVMQPYSKTTNSTNTQSSSPGLGQIIGAGLGAASLGFAAPASGSLFGNMFSDEAMKEDITEAKMTPKAALAAFEKIPVKDWNYDQESQEKYDLPPDRVTGPMAQDYGKHLGSSRLGPDGKQMVDTADTLGKMTLAIKELARRTKKAA